MSPELIVLCLNLAGVADVRLALGRLGKRVGVCESKLGIAPLLMLASMPVALLGCMDSARAAGVEGAQAAADAIASGVSAEQATAIGVGSFVAGLLGRELPRVITRIRSR